MRETQPGISITGQSDRRSSGSEETSRSNAPSYSHTQTLVNTSRKRQPWGSVTRLKPTLSACLHTTLSFRNGTVSMLFTVPSYLYIGSTFLVFYFEMKRYHDCHDTLRITFSLFSPLWSFLICPFSHGKIDSLFAILNFSPSVQVCLQPWFPNIHTSSVPYA